MRPSVAIFFVLATGIGRLEAAPEDTDLIKLRNNPFSRPAVVLAPPPPPPPPRVIVPEEEVDLEVTATMVSETAPMAVVDGELLALGDRIQGFKLIAVLEGKAIFVRGGRKYTFEIAGKLPTQGGKGITRYD